MDDASIAGHILVWVGGATAVLAFLEALRRVVVSPGRKMLKEVQQFLSDWKGEPERPGVPARPGFPEQIATLNAKMARVEYHTGNGQEPALRAMVGEALTLAREAKQRIEDHEETVRKVGEWPTAANVLNDLGGS